MYSSLSLPSLSSLSPPLSPSSLLLSSPHNRCFLRSPPVEDLKDEERRRGREGEGRGGGGRGGGKDSRITGMSVEDRIGEETSNVEKDDLMRRREKREREKCVVRMKRRIELRDGRKD